MSEPEVGPAPYDEFERGRVLLIRKIEDAAMDNPVQIGYYVDAYVEYMLKPILDEIEDLYRLLNVARGIER